MPIEAPSLVEYDVLVQPDPGGTKEALSPFDNTIIIVKPKGRISPPEEPQSQKDFTSIDSQEYMQTVTQRRREFYSTLGLLDQLNVVRNYDIPLARVMWEQMKTEEQKNLFLAYETEQVLSAQDERHGITDKTPRFLIDSSSKLRSVQLPVEPFEAVDKRAVEHYRNLKSPDVVREEAGYIGRLKIQEKMVNPNTPIGFTMIVVSGPGLNEGSQQKGNFVQFYILKQDLLTGERYVEMIPFVSKADYSQYKKGAFQIKPTYFNEQTQAIDLYFLQNPIEIEHGSIEEIFTQLTGETIDRRTDSNFQKFKDENKDRVEYFLEAVVAPIFDPQEAKKRWHAVVAGADIIWKNLQRISQKVLEITVNIERFIPTFANMAQEVDFLVKQKVEDIVAPCGLTGALGGSSGGILASVGNLISNVIGAIGGLFGFKDKDFCINCGACGAEIRRVVRRGQKCPECPAVRRC